MYDVYVLSCEDVAPDYARFVRLRASLKKGRNVMNNHRPVRWMVSFWHPEGDSKDEPDFPKVEQWHQDKPTARAEAARVLIELRESRGDDRDWVAAGHPDPLAVGAGRHVGGQWTLRYGDLKKGDASSRLTVEERLKGAKSAAGSWKGLIDGEELKRTLHEARHSGSRVGPIQ